jgi:ribosomal protein L10
MWSVLCTSHLPCLPMAALSRRTLRHEQAIALANTLFVGKPKFVLAVLADHIPTARLLEIKKALTVLPGASFRTFPHSVARHLIADTKFAPLAPLLSGKVRLLVTDHPVATAKTAMELAKKYPTQFILLGGCYEGTPLNQALIKTISELPVDDTARVQQQFGQVVALMRNPAFHLYRSLSQHKEKLGYGLLRVKQLKEKEAKAAEAPPAAAAAAATAPAPAAAAAAASAAAK